MSLIGDSILSEQTTVESAVAPRSKLGDGIVSGNLSAAVPTWNKFADNVTLIGQIVLDNEESNTLPCSSVSDCRTLSSGPPSELFAGTDAATGVDQLAGANVFGTEPKYIGKYQIRAILGQGGMGVVYQAFDPMIEREVALKVLSPEVSNSPLALQRFLGEARSIGRLNHPNVVSIYEISEWNGMYYLVMELLTGGSVADLAEKSGIIAWPEACRIGAEAARGLAAAHSAGMIHRDIKPANLMLTRSGDVKVVDFGLSKILNTSDNLRDAMTHAGQLLGTPQYMSPEQFDGAAVDARTDVYALGATLFRLLTNKFPYNNCGSIMQLMKAHMTLPVPTVSQRNREVPAECSQIIFRAMAKDPMARYASCSDMASELEALLTRRPIPQTAALPSHLMHQHHGFERVLSSAVVIEPSRLQAAIRTDLLTQAGATTVQTARSVAEADALLQNSQPDVIWTAMELPDGLGLDWLRSVGESGRLEKSTVVLNSSDCSVPDLVSIGKSGCLILAPKTARLESIIRVIHGAGPVRFTQNTLTASVDPASAPIRLISDTSRIPDALTLLLKELQLENIENATGVRTPPTVTPSGTSAAVPSAAVPSTPYLTVLIRTVFTRPGDEPAYAAMVSRGRPELSAAVQSHAGKLYLRAVGHSGVIALLNRSLDASSLHCLLQAGR